MMLLQAFNIGNHDEIKKKKKMKIIEFKAKLVWFAYNSCGHFLLEFSQFKFKLNFLPSRFFFLKQ